jgi:hypothetical protein
LTNSHRQLGHWLVIVFATWILLTAGGCRRNGRVDVSPVRGKVVYKGQGVSNTTVIFHPVSPGSETVGKMRPFAYGQPDGQFEIKTYVEGDGAPPGKYRVSIIAPINGQGVSKKDRPVEAQVSAPVVGVPPEIAKKYANVDTSGIEVTIRSGENNLEPFELTMGPAGAASSAGGSRISSQN